MVFLNSYPGKYELHINCSIVSIIETWFDDVELRTSSGLTRNKYDAAELFETPSISIQKYAEIGRIPFLLTMIEICAKKM